MEQIIISTYKITTKLSLAQLASYFNIKKDAGRKEFIKIKSDEIEKILMYDSYEKSVYMYKYGCISFVNFNQHEINYFMEYLTKIYVEIDNKLLLKFNETHVMPITNGNLIRLWKGSDEKHLYQEMIVDIVSTVLAKSIELHKIETELLSVLDESGLLIKYLNKGRLKANSKKVISIIAKCTRFKFSSMESVRILDRPSEFGKTIESRKIFNDISNFYELDDRYKSFLNRTGILDSITEEYFDLKSKLSERRLLMFEILLLAVFPLMHFI